MKMLEEFACKLSYLSQHATYPLLAVVENNSQVEALYALLKFWSKTLPILCFPDWETLPYDHLSPPFQRIAQRLQTLHNAPHFSKGIIITTTTAVLQYVPPLNYIQSHIFHFSKGDDLDITALKNQLLQNGYQPVLKVEFPGDFSIRGSIVDFFPIAAKQPFRLDINITKISDLFYFDPETQQVTHTRHTLSLIPVREFSLSEKSIQTFKAKWLSNFGQKSIESAFYQQISSKSYPSGIEYYLPLFFESMNTLFDYLPQTIQCVSPYDLQEKIGMLWKNVCTRYAQFNADVHRPILEPTHLYQLPQDFLIQLKQLYPTTLNDTHNLTLPFSQKSFQLILEPLSFLSHQKKLTPIEQLQNFLQSVVKQVKEKTVQILFCVNRTSQIEFFRQQLSIIGYIPKETTHFLSEEILQIAVISIHRGFWIKSKNIIVVPDTILDSVLNPELSNKESKLRERKKEIQAFAFEDLSRVRLNTPVVHTEHGIGQYLGLQKLNTGHHETELITLAYAHETKLYIPITDIAQISPYQGQKDPPLSHLKSAKWKNTKQSTLVKLKDTAAELLEIYAQRAQAKGYAFPKPNDYQQFCQDFKFQETPDQIDAIEAVTSDLCAEKPMDRLICGDVGFGKTEVAMRAAFIVTRARKQVAVLAPTTLLVEQHTRNFQDRFANYAVKINCLSRFQTLKEQRDIRVQLQKGQIDIIIGTHTLFNKETHFNALGLLVIDEEHHFGVYQKEHFKRMTKAVDTLTLTATPIPRTLQIALSGLKELSIIATPPLDRLPIKNIIIPRQSALIREAILRELARGGQVYFVHNRVTTLARITEEIEKLVPEARIISVHGQLPEKTLEAHMSLFYQQHYNLLVCTSIIETGLDIATANTLIVDRADHFGLAQLHQLRGRIGRTHHQAYAYFLMSDEKALTKDARKRLEAIGHLSQLGAGFNLASYDLDIRGAGELLGDQQSGLIKGVGFSLYMELLEKTVQALKEGKDIMQTSLLTNTPIIELHIPCFFPENYLSDVGVRLSYYKKIATLRHIEMCNALRTELENRYGPLPDSGKNLFEVTLLKWKAQALGIEKIEANAAGGSFLFQENPNIDPTTMLDLIQRTPEQFQLESNHTAKKQKLKFKWLKQIEGVHRITAINDLLYLIKYQQ